MRRPVIKKALIVYKKSSYQKHALDERDGNYLKLLREDNVAIRRSRRTHDQHMITLRTIRRDLKKLAIPFDVRLRYRLGPIRGYDLVITVGGDGTFLDTAHFVEGGLLLGVNSVPFESVGFFCRTDHLGFFRKMRALLAGRAPIKPLHRLKTTIDGSPPLPLALNDVLFTNQNPAGTTRYLIRIGGQKEEHKSSGIWISPAAGSSAATRSAGGRLLPLASGKMQYVVREPYEPPGRRYRLLKGILGERQKITLVPMMDDAALFIDGPHTVVPVSRGSRITLENARQPLSVVW